VLALLTLCRQKLEAGERERARQELETDFANNASSTAVLLF